MIESYLVYFGCTFLMEPALRNKALRPPIPSRLTEQKLCIEITYVEITKPFKRWIYVCAVKDLYNNEIVVYTVNTRQNMKLILQTLHQLKEKGFMKGILHSNQGFHFTNPSYIRNVIKIGLTQSMSRRGNCWDNACIENFFGHLKAEMPHPFQDAHSPDLLF
jgi:putative transposase